MGEELEGQLRRELAAIPWVDFAYLFGSTARGQAGPESDIDLAVRVRGPQVPSDAFWQLLRSLRAGGDRLHLVLLDDAPPLLRHEVFRDGKLVFERDPESRIRFRVCSEREYLDMEPSYRRYREVLKQRYREGRFTRNGSVDKKAPGA